MTDVTKKRRWIIPLVILVVLAAVAALWMSDKALSVGRFISGENGGCFIALDDRPVLVHYIGGANCGPGDRVLVIHRNVFAESWPEQTKGYFMVKLGEGTDTDIPESALEVLRESGYLPKTETG